jgi:arabinose-5-phosphate isomerase
MRKGDELPVVDPDSSMSEVVVTMSEKALGVAILVRERPSGDHHRRGPPPERRDSLGGAALRHRHARTPSAFAPDMLVKDAMELMSQRKITACLVEDESRKLAGLLHIHDCIRSGAAD